MKHILLLFVLLAGANAEDTCGCSESQDYRAGTWKLLHTIAAKQENTHECSMHLAMFIESLSRIYPCKECRKHMEEFIIASMEQDPPDMPQCSERWMCNFHNDVNNRLGKKQFDCSKFPDDLLNLMEEPPELVDEYDPTPSQ